MRILLTGSTGYVGKAVLAELLSAGHQVHALVRKAPSATPTSLAPSISTSNPPAGRGAGTSHVQYTVGSLTDPHALAAAAAGCDGAIHLVGIIAERPRDGVTFHAVHTEGTRAVLNACQAAGVSRYVHMSALGTRANAVSEYHRTKWQAEELVRASRLQWTILRPGMIVPPPVPPPVPPASSLPPGPPSPDAPPDPPDPPDPGEFVRMVRGWATGKAVPYFFFPYFGRGLLGLGPKSLLSPVLLPDVARAFVSALTPPASTATVHQTFDLAGPTTLTFPALYRHLATTQQFPTRSAIPIPAWYAKLLTAVLPASLLPFNKSQVQMAEEDNTATDAERSRFTHAFGWSPRAIN